MFVHIMDRAYRKWEVEVAKLVNCCLAVLEFLFLLLFRYNSCIYYMTYVHDGVL